MRVLLPLVVTLIATPGVLAEEPTPGQRVRLQVGDVIEAPGMGRMDSEEYRLVGRATPASKTVTVVRDGGETVTLPRPKTHWLGEVVASDGDTLTIRLANGNARVSVPRASIERLEVSRGRRPGSALRGAAIGIGVGGTAGALLGLSAGDDRCPPSRPNEGFFGWNGCLALFSAGDKAKMGAVVFGAVGGLVGAAVSASRGERWERVDQRPRKIGVAVGPVGTRGIALALRF